MWAVVSMLVVVIGAIIGVLWSREAGCEEAIVLHCQQSAETNTRQDQQIQVLQQDLAWQGDALYAVAQEVGVKTLRPPPRRPMGGGAER